MPVRQIIPLTDIELSTLTGHNSAMSKAAVDSKAVLDDLNSKAADRQAFINNLLTSRGLPISRRAYIVDGYLVIE
jgi:hypothetical protein